MVEKNERLEDALNDLKQVLRDEARALRSLDREGIDRAAAAKLELDERIRSLLARGAPEPALQDALEGIRRAAIANQLLLVHARNCVRSVLALASGQPVDDPRISEAPPPMRVDFRG